MTRLNCALAFLALVLLNAGCGGGGGGIDNTTPPSKAPTVTGEVTHQGTSSVHAGSAANDLYVRIVVVNPNPAGTDVGVIRYCLKHDPGQDSPLTAAEAKTYLDPVPANLPANVDVQTVDYTGSPQIIEIREFKGGQLTPDDRYWLSAVFVSSAGVAGPVTPPQRFKLIFKYQLVQPPEIGIVKTFEGTVYDHNCQPLRNAFVQYFHEGHFLEAAVTENDGTYYFEVVVPNPEVSWVHGTSCEESNDETDYVLKVYHPYYSQECVKYLLPEYVHYYVDFTFNAEWHNQGEGDSL